MSAVLDTHAWIWWVAEPRWLSPAAHEEIARARDDGSLFVSTASVWELGALVIAGRLELSLSPRDWVAACEALPYLEVLPVLPHIALRAHELPAAIGDDPIDRMIAATAETLGASLITRDRRMHAALGGRAVW